MAESGVRRVDTGVPVLVVDINEEAPGDPEATGVPHLLGDAVEESVLRAAGIE